ncbi:hypothetical protein CDD83_9764 [Cordyceps sp. RAO-2017]|nr:hypothetical protein CDD83_9764 [Cordyceps sp. RAO-2017]
MILRSAVARHGRCALASPPPRSSLRQLSTDVKIDNGTGEVNPEILDGLAETSSKVSSKLAAPRLSVSSKKKKHKIVRDLILSLGARSGQEHKSASWTRPHQVGQESMTPAQQYNLFMKTQLATGQLGTAVEKRYVPSELINNPPRPEDVTLELLMASQTHMGHNTSLWNPANSRYIFGVRQGIHIISLETTAAHLRRAARVVEEVTYRGGLILFVGTRKGQMEIVTRAAEMAGACHLFTKWMPGTITNRDVILGTKNLRVVDHEDRQLPGFETFGDTARPLLPDLVVCLNPLENYTLLHECGLKNIPTIGVIDTDTDPSWVTYTIPANDDSLRAMAVVGGVLGRAGERGKKRRLEDAAKGSVGWRMHEQVKRFIDKKQDEAIEQMKKVMGKMQDNIEGFSQEEKDMLAKSYLHGKAEGEADSTLEIMSKTISGGDEAAATADERAARKVEEAMAAAMAEPQAVETEQAEQVAEAAAAETQEEATGQAEKVAKAVAGAQTAPRLEEVEAQLRRVGEQAADIEAAIEKRAEVSPEGGSSVQ